MSSAVRAFVACIFLISDNYKIISMYQCPVKTTQLPSPVGTTDYSVGVLPLRFDRIINNAAPVRGAYFNLI